MNAIARIKNGENWNGKVYNGFVYLGGEKVELPKNYKELMIEQHIYTKDQIDKFKGEFWSAREKFRPDLESLSLRISDKVLDIYLANTTLYRIDQENEGASVFSYFEKAVKWHSDRNIECTVENISKYIIEY